MVYFSLRTPTPVAIAVYYPSEGVVSRAEICADTCGLFLPPGAYVVAVIDRVGYLLMPDGAVELGEVEIRATELLLPRPDDQSLVARVARTSKL